MAELDTRPYINNLQLIRKRIQDAQALRNRFFKTAEWTPQQVSLKPIAVNALAAAFCVLAALLAIFRGVVHSSFSGSVSFWALSSC